jgi:hypothetical protein
MSHHKCLVTNVKLRCQKLSYQSTAANCEEAEECDDVLTHCDRRLWQEKIYLKLTNLNICKKNYFYHEIRNLIDSDLMMKRDHGVVEDNGDSVIQK